MALPVTSAIDAQNQLRPALRHDGLLNRPPWGHGQRANAERTKRAQRLPRRIGGRRRSARQYQQGANQQQAQQSRRHKVVTSPPSKSPIWRGVFGDAWRGPHDPRRRWITGPAGSNGRRRPMLRETLMTTRPRRSSQFQSRSTEWESRTTHEQMARRPEAIVASRQPQGH